MARREAQERCGAALERGRKHAVGLGAPQGRRRQARKARKARLAGAQVDEPHPGEHWEGQTCNAHIFLQSIVC